MFFILENLNLFTKCKRSRSENKETEIDIFYRHCLKFKCGVISDTTDERNLFLANSYSANKCKSIYISDGNVFL